LNTTLQERGSRSSAESSLRFVPNPMEEESWVYPMNAIGDLQIVQARSLEILGLDGRIIHQLSLQGDETPWRIQKGELQAGLYVIQVKDVKGMVYHGKLVVK
jgi:hypothetical protein